MLEIAKLLVRLQATTGDGMGRYLPTALFQDVCIVLERIEAGNLTEEEIHNLCHNLPATVPLREFAKGCQRHMLKLYGECPAMERMMSFKHVHVGDTVTRILGDGIPMHLVVTGLEDGKIQCGDWEFDPETGAEIDDLLEWGPKWGRTGSYLVNDRSSVQHDDDGSPKPRGDSGRDPTPHAADHS